MFSVVFFVHWMGMNTDKKENQIFLIYKEIQSGAVKIHIWLTASSYMGKYFRISSYIRKHFLIYDFTTAPFWISLYMRKILFYFLSVRWNRYIRRGSRFFDVVLFGFHPPSYHSTFLITLTVSLLPVYSRYSLPFQADVRGGGVAGAK
jgi:hypothetical protein